jgi:hypothetical protein
MHALLHVNEEINTYHVKSILLPNSARFLVKKVPCFLLPFGVVTIVVGQWSCTHANTHMGLDNERGMVDGGEPNNCHNSFLQCPAQYGL